MTTHQRRPALNVGLPPTPERGAVLAAVKAKPSGRPASGLDPGCGRRPIAAIGGSPRVNS